MTYILPYFDYCDSVFGGHITIGDEIRLERLQNRAARLVTGADFRTSTDALRRELGWVRLRTRREMHELIFYRKLLCEPEKFPNYITELLPSSRQKETGRMLRNANSQTLPLNRTTSFNRSFFPHATRLWNKLPEAIRLLPEAKSFKNALIQKMGVGKMKTFYTYGSKKGNRLHTQLRLGMSPLNSHQYTITKCPSPKCSCGHFVEDTVHFALTCSKFQQHRTQLFTNVSRILKCDFNALKANKKLDILLHGTGLNACQGRRV